MARLNGSSLGLSPKREEIARDVELFLKYMDGYEKFHGDVIGMQRRYYEFANWFFCSPFMAGMRDIAERYNHEPLPYPVFGVIYGQSKAGKTSLFGHAAENDDWPEGEDFGARFHAVHMTV